MKTLIDFVKKMWNFFFHTEMGLYLVFGVLTTVVSLLVGLPLLWLGVNDAIANLLKNVAGIIFAYVTNRLYVFRSETKGAKQKEEMVSFFISRIATLVLDMGMMFLLADVLKVNETLSMILSTFIVIVLNYVLSKLFVFKK